MSTDITGLCRDHSFETASDVCRRCGLEFCEDCVVHPFGAKKPFCKECAMVEGGVRTHSSRAAQSPRVIKKRVKEFEQLTSPVGAAGPDTPALVDPVLQDWLDTAPEETEPTAGRGTAADRTADDHDTDAEPQPAPVPMMGDEPADGVAPPIDWSKPFG